MTTALPPPLPIGANAHALRQRPSYGSEPQSQAPSTRSQGLRHTGKLITSGSGVLQDQRPPSSALSVASSVEHNRVDHGPPEPPSARTGLMFSRSAPSLTPRDEAADMVASMKNVHLKRRHAKPESIPKAVWSDSHLHLEKDEWPAHAVPLWVFHGKDRPRPGFKEQVRFTVREEKYINYCVRIRCGVGDRFNGGTVGLVYSSDQKEAGPGTEGQLITIIDTLAQPNNTVTITAVGDVAFRVKSAWMPRGMMGLQVSAPLSHMPQIHFLHVEIDTMQAVLCQYSPIERDFWICVDMVMKYIIFCVCFHYLFEFIDLTSTLNLFHDTYGRSGQVAHIEAVGQTVKLDTIIDTCATEPSLTVFARLMASVPSLSELLGTQGPFTAFIPTNEALANLGIAEEELLASPELENIVACHICPGRVPCEAMYSGRTMQALDGTIKQVTFKRWPRGNAAVNEVPIEFMDIPCSNGLVHSICGLIRTCPAPNRRRQ